MKGRIEKMPSVTNARVANVQKKSLDRNAWKKAINAGSCRAASTVTTPLATKTAAMGQSQAPSGARRIANRAMSATRKAAIQIMTPSRTVSNARLALKRRSRGPTGPPRSRGRGGVLLDRDHGDEQRDGHDHGDHAVAGE